MAIQYTKEEFMDALKSAKDARDKIIELYNNTLYEDNWDQKTIEQFEDFLSSYNTSFAIIKTSLPYVSWTSDKYKKEFMQNYYNVIEEDNNIFNLVKIRHDAYLTYRTNRKSLIKQLNNVAGLVKQKGKKNYVEVFDYFNNVCAKVNFYSNKDEHGNITVLSDPNLHKWFYRNVSGTVADINDSTMVEGNYSAEECAKVFNKYEYCRKMIFKIFNMITSSSKMNGYEKWHNVLDDFCQADLKDIQMEKLYYAANTEDDFIPVDDQYQTMDDRAWNEKGIYESYDYDDDDYDDDDDETIFDDFDEKHIDPAIKQLNNQQMLLSDELYNLCNDEFFYSTQATVKSRSKLGDGYCFEVVKYVLDNLEDSKSDISDIHCYFIENESGDYHYYFECDGLYFDGYNYPGVSKVSMLKFFRKYFKKYIDQKIIENSKEVTNEINDPWFSPGDGKVVKPVKNVSESWWNEDVLFYNSKRKQPIKADIVKIDMQDPAYNACKVVTNGKAVFAGTTFYPGDIIEICPTRSIDKSSLYSKDMREIVFEVIPNTQWVLPFGYCQYYDIQTDKDKANCNFIWDPTAKVIVIKALNKIKKHEKLILNNSCEVK